MKNFLINEIKHFVRYEGNSYFEFLEGNGYKDPIVKFASAKDPIFSDYKEIIGNFHLTPIEAYESRYGKGTLENGTVISIALPYSDEVIESNRNRDWPSEKWTLMRTFGIDHFGNYLSDYVKDLLDEKGYNSVVPSRQEIYEKIRVKSGPLSNWSERHIAYATGMGTFSLNAGFITEKGVAITLVSIVTNLVIEPSSRTFKDHTSNCLYYHKGKCKKCIKKCPANALSEKGIDKFKCQNLAYGEKAQKYAKSLGANPKSGSGCGLCQIDVPCESQNPTKPKIK